MTLLNCCSLKPHKAVASVALLGALIGCGESDLPALHDERIDAAVREAQLDNTDVSLGAGMPTNPPAEGPVTEPGAEPDAQPVDASPVPSAATREAIAVDEYTLVFNDEFNGEQLDSTKWNTSLPWGPDLTINDEMQYYVDTQAESPLAYNPFAFDGEALTISAVPTPENLQDSVNGQAYVSGALSSFRKFDWTYGYVEARIDLPEGTGLWPSFWMLGSEFKDLKPQLYVMEFNGSEPNSLYHNYNYTDSEGNLRSPRQHEIVVNGASEGWQTVGLRWSEGELVFYVNGYPTFQVNGENVSSQAMYVMLNLAVGGLWVDTPDETTPNPAQLKVDYVRVYQANS